MINPQRKPIRILLTSVLMVAGVLIVMSILDYSPLIYAAALVSQDGQISGSFRSSLLSRQFWLGISLAAAAFPAAVLITRSPGNAFLKKTEKWAVPAACITGGLTALVLQFLMFDNIPHVTDATCHYFQGRIFAEGRLSAQVPPCPDAFYQHNMVMTESGKWFARYPPGTALIIGAGHKTGMPWLPLPLFHAISIAAFYALASRFFTKGTARLAAWMYAMSPLALLLGSSYMSHTPFMACAMAGLALFLDPKASTTRTWLSGIVFGITVLFRPQDTAITALVTVICLLFATRSAWMMIVKRLPPAALGGLIPLVIFLAYNAAQYGTWLTTGYGFNHDQALHRGISVSMGLSASYPLEKALMHNANILYKFNEALFGWPTSLVFLAVPFVRRENIRRMTACLAGILFVAGFFFFYSYPAYEFEARFWILLTPLCIVMTCEGIRVCIQHSYWRLPCIILVSAMYAYAALYYWPQYIWPRYSDDYEQASTAPTKEAMRLAAVKEGRNILVLMESNQQRDFVYSGGFIFNDPKLENQVLFARYDPEQVPCLLEAFPHREIYIMEPGGFRIRKLDESAPVRTN